MSHLSAALQSLGTRLLAMLGLMLALGAFSSWYTLSHQAELADEVQQLTGSAHRQDPVATHTQELRERLDQHRSRLLGLILAGTVLGAALLAWVFRHLVGPLRANARAARRMAKGDFDLRLTVPGRGEIAEMSGALNLLADAVVQRETLLRDSIDRDALSGLPQRNRFLGDHADRVRGDGAHAVLVFDIERLKTINAVLGFEAGDAVIVETARRASEASNGAAARLAGGAFAAVLTLPDDVPHSENQAQLLAERFQRALERTTAWQGHAMDLAVTVGVALAPLHGRKMPALLHTAEQALYLAKRQRRSVVVHVPSASDADAARREHLTLHSELQSAIENGQLVPFLQPKLCLKTDRIVGAEALVRWRHPERGWVPPSEFIPFAESTGRIAQVTRTMLAQCVALLADENEHDDSLGGISIAVNISTYDLRDAGFANRLGGLLRQHGVAARRLQIEVTETGLLDSGSEPVQRLHALRAQGVGLAIDDFGVGQSSLAYLQRLPAQELKIDRAFVSGVDRDATKRGLFEAIVRLGHSLKLMVTAEGVETEGELAVAREAGCDTAQGYRIAKPMAAADFRRWCRARRHEQPPTNAGLVTA